MRFKVVASQIPFRYTVVVFFLGLSWLTIVRFFCMAAQVVLCGEALMTNQIVLPREALVTHIAFEEFIASVCAEMTHQDRLPRESLSANPSLKRPRFCMNGHGLSYALFFCKRSLANVTKIILWHIGSWLLLQCSLQAYRNHHWPFQHMFFLELQ